MSTQIPPHYRRLLLTYPRAWRRAHEAVVLGTLLEADSAAGRLRPTRRDRMGLLLGGLLVRLPHRAAVVHAAPLPVAVAGFHLFDQGNGAAPEREPTESELERWNAAHAPRRDGGETPVALPGAIFGNGFGNGGL
jgi:hypothetical protein